jgi:hypothetical protein
MNAHLSDDQLLDRMYGAAAGDDAHLASCLACAARLNALKERRSELAAAAEISSEFLAAQRRRILQQLEHRQWRAEWKWLPALAAACALAIALFVYRPSAPKPPAQMDAADQQLFSEVYSMEQSTEPRAAVPIHALFDGIAVEENK